MISRLKLPLLGAALLMLGPIGWSYAASPSPNPSLDTFLATPPETNYVELSATTQGVIEGPFDAEKYIKMGSTTDPASVRATLDRDGFIGGFGRTWVQTGTRRALVEAVVAFKGAEGAKKWLVASEVADKGDVNYKRSLSTSGLDSYYGAHFESANSFVDEISFVKGNDYFIVATAGPADDAGTRVSKQAKTQFDKAPDSTIPKDQWPETVASKAATSVGGVVGGIVVAVIVLALLAVGAVVVMRRRRPQMAMAGGVPGAMPGAMPGAVPGAAAVTVSADGKYWWDGQAWKDAAIEVPPTAQRSGDGRMWWDGSTWRPVP
jgi:hypothetical protein